MKNAMLILPFVFMFSFQGQSHNLFNCRNDDFSQFLYFSKSSFAGVPHLGLRNEAQDVYASDVEWNEVESEIFVTGKSSRGAISFRIPEYDTSFVTTASIGCTYVQFICEGQTVAF